ncbi:MAG: hypothetical protein IPK17_37820 [Chloroflexi bacterium]|uniref:GNAT family N-acetyltransferase n=1 Tax=Candidatus Flexifilum breve TaxID=3140694 RepID=UPI0031370A60|nr:hypothetical protein [Chloroflexota bacterium]
MPVPFLGNELLRGERVRLARLLDSDYALLARWTEDMENQRLLRRSMVYPSDERDMRDWLGKVDEYQFIPFGIRTLDDDRLVGMLAIKDIFLAGAALLVLHQYRRSSGSGVRATARTRSR